LNSGAVKGVVTPYRESLPRPAIITPLFLLLSSAVCKLRKSALKPYSLQTHNPHARHGNKLYEGRRLIPNLLLA
jgi:hypothetical protein